MATKTPTEIPFSFFEYRAVYAEPLFALWGQHGGALLSIYRAFKEWNVTPENITAKEGPANAGDLQVSFNLLHWRMVFNFGIAFSSLVASNPDWSEADIITRIAQSGVAAVRESTGVEIAKQQATLSMHLKPVGRTVKDVTAPLVRPDLERLAKDRTKAFGLSIYGENASVVVDLSATYADSLFVRLTRSFDGSIPLDVIAREIRGDEDAVSDLLGLEIE